MSYFLAGALLTLAFNLLHTFSMVIAFDGLREGKRERWAAVPIAHLGAALLVSQLITLLSNVPDCVKTLCMFVSPCQLCNIAGKMMSTAWGGKGSY